MNIDNDILQLYNYHQTLLNKIPLAIQISKMLYNEQNEPIDYIFIDVNTMFAETSGLKQKDIIGKKITDLIPDIKSEWFKKIHSIIKTNKSKSMEIYSESIGLWHNISIIPIKKDDIFAISYTNITKQKKAEIALKESKNKYQKLYEVSNDGFWHFDKNGNIVNMNKATFNITGFSRKELIGKNWRNFITSDWHKKIIYEEGILRSGKPTHYEIKIKKKDGNPVWVLLNESPIFDEEGNYNGSIAAFKDITARKIAEEEFFKSKKEALTLVRELEKADEMKNEFISMLSHELKNPLSIILAGAQLLQLTNEKNTNVIETIKRQTSHLVKLVDDLLDITRITQNKVLLNIQRINLSIVFKNVIDDIRPQFEKRNIKLFVDIPDDDIIINADSLRITQCIGNLLNNAMKFTPEKGLVKASLKTEGKMAIISIEDNGIGISPDILANIFDTFIQGSSPFCNLNNMGLGIGLSIVKSLVEKHNGQVSASSLGVDKGASFKIQLPIADPLA